MKKAIGLFLAALMLLTVLPGAVLLAEADTDGTQTGTSTEQKGTIVNCKTQVNVREKASKSSKLLGTAKKGESFPVLGTSGDWVRIDFNGKDGYVFHTYIKIDGSTDAEITETAVEGKVGTIVNCKKEVNVREKPTSLSKLLGTAKKGKSFKVLAKAGNWVKIAFESETAGYVYKSYIRITDENGTTPDETVTEGKVGKIVNCRKMANVREEASSKSKLLGTVKKGTKYTVLGTSGDWVKIRYNGKEGYVYKTYVKITEPEESIDGKTGTIVNCSTQVNVREKATKSSKLLGTAKKGETFTVRGRSGNWIEIEYNGKTGYVYKTYIKIK